MKPATGRRSILNATWQRCRFHFIPNAMAHARRTQCRIVAAWIGTAFAETDSGAARAQWRKVADQARPAAGAQADGLDGRRRGGRARLS